MKRGEEATLVVKPEYGFGTEGRGADVPANATLEIGITLLGWSKVEKVTDDGLVMKKTLEDSEEWKKPNAGSQCTISYTARLPDGAVFDARGEDDPLTFTTDEGQVVEGLDQAVMKMKEGERALVTVAPQYAFGDQDSQQAQAVVPAGSAVEYDVKLLSFVKAKDSWEMDPAEKLASAAGLKDKGNVAFKAANFRRAIQHYDKAMQAVEFDEGFDADQKKAAKEAKKSCNLNLAAAHLKLGNAAEARKAADKVLEVDSSNCKALYRRAQAWMATADYVEAELDIRAGLAQEPDSNDFKLLLKRWRAQQAAAAKKEAGLYSGMMKALGGGGGKKGAGAAAPAAPAAAAEAAAANGEAAAGNGTEAAATVES